MTKKNATMTINERLEKMEKEMQRLRNISDILNEIESNQRYYMTLAKDENGNYIEDENGNYVYNKPCEDDWNYEKYMIYEEIKEFLLK